MSETASIYVHLDWHIGHCVKILMDEIFGEDNFRNEIIWKRFNFHSDAGRFGAVHESIYYYAMNCDTCVFNTVYIPFDDEYIKSRFTNVDENGRRYLTDNPTAPAHGATGTAMYFGDKLISPPTGSMWRYSQENINRLMAEGRIKFTNRGLPRIKRYLDELEGKAAHSVWTDIFPINSQAEERISKYLRLGMAPYFPRR